MNYQRAMFGLCLTLATSVGCIKREAAPQQPMNPEAKPGAAVVASTAEAPTQPTGLWGKVAGVDLLNGQGTEAFTLMGQLERVKLTRIPVTGMPFNTAYRVQVLSSPTNTYDVQLEAKPRVAVEKGDVLLASLYFRTEWAPQENAEGESEFVFELAKDPYTKSVTYPLRASRDWKQINIPFVAGQNYAPGDAQMMFRLGYQKEIIEFGAIEIRNFGKQLALADLPVTRITYRGMDPNAAWRKAAEDRIEQNRKAALNVVVRDAAGKPIKGATVKMNLTKHAFGFGTCVPAARINSAGDAQFKALTAELFNVATLENDLKWVPLAGDWGKSFTTANALTAIDWLGKQGLAVRGHVLVWPGWTNLPKSLRALEKDPMRLKGEVDKHIRELTAATKGKLAHWDVLNEPYDNHDLLDILGNDVMVEWFKTAHEVDPQAKLFINDYAILSGGGGTSPHRDHYEKTIRMLIDKSAPFDGIGMQGHFGTSLTSPDDLLQILDRFAKFNKTIWVTEYDVVVDDEALAGSYTRDFYTTLFSHPAVGGIVMWGFWDGSHWKNNAPLYRHNWTPKPAADAYRELVKHAWMTNATEQTDDKGAARVRGFLGTYDIDVMSAGKHETVVGQLVQGGSTVIVTVK
jgi:GH35 family endo-1,4-beta-xylanase